jgi:hypothetical protein
MKRCGGVCRQLKDESEFSESKSTFDNLCYSCKSCIYNYNRDKRIKLNSKDPCDKCEMKNICPGDKIMCHGLVKFFNGEAIYKRDVVNPTKEIYNTQFTDG